MRTVPPRTTQAAALLVVAATLAGAPRAAAQYEQIDACIQESETAVVLKKAGKLLDERKALSECAGASCPDPVKTSCRERLAAVVHAIPTIVFALKDARGRDLAPVKVTIDGAASPENVDGAIALDPGLHEFRFEVSGRDPTLERFVLREGEQERHETIVVGAAADPVLPSPPRRAPSRSIALALTGVGAGALVAGGIVAGLSLAAHDAYENYCGANVGAPAGRCSALAVPGERDAAAKGSLATGLFIGGGVLAAGGLVWFFVSPKSRSSMQVGFGLGGIHMKGDF